MKRYAIYQGFLHAAALSQSDDCDVRVQIIGQAVIAFRTEIEL